MPSTKSTQVCLPYHSVFAGNVSHNVPKRTIVLAVSTVNQFFWPTHAMLCQCIAPQPCKFHFIQLVTEGWPRYTVQRRSWSLKALASNHTATTTGEMASSRIRKSWPHLSVTCQILDPSSMYVPFVCFMDLLMRPAVHCSINVAASLNEGHLQFVCQTAILGT